VEAIAIDDRSLVDTYVVVIEVDFCGETSSRCGNFGNGHQRSDVEHFRTSE